MITGSELLRNLEEIKKKSEFIQVVYPNNPIWEEVDSKLGELISLLKKDMKIFGY